MITYSPTCHLVKSHTKKKLCKSKHIFLWIDYTKQGIFFRVEILTKELFFGSSLLNYEFNNWFEAIKFYNTNKKW